MSKISFRFFNDRPVRAVWDEEHSKWWFSVPDVVGVLNAQDDYTKNRNYWKYLKNKLKADGNEVVSETNQLRLTAPDGKKRLTTEKARLRHTRFSRVRCLTVSRSGRSRGFSRFMPTCSAGYMISPARYGR